MLEIAPAHETDFRSVTASKTPVVVRSCHELLRGTEKWSAEYFRDIVGTRSVRVSLGTSASTSATHAAPLPIGSMGMDEFATRVFLDHDPAAKYFYLMDNLLGLPELSEDFKVPEFLHANQLAIAFLWVGGNELTSRLHYDIFENFFVQLKGSKRFTIFPPTLRGFYPNPVWGHAPFVSRVNLRALTANEFPAFDPKKGEHVTLHEGDCLYLPHCWWHEVDSLADFNVSVSMWWYQRLGEILRLWPQYAWTLPLFIRKQLTGTMRRLQSNKRH